MAKKRKSSSNKDMILIGRDKYWNELNAHERVSRMREIVKSQGNKIKDLEEQVRNLIEHSHGNNGEITVPFKSKDTSGLVPTGWERTQGSEEGEVYF